MQVTRLQVDGLRVLAGVGIEPGPRLNFISGSNGSGKTSLLEAVYLAGHGRSFRSRHTRDLIRRGGAHLSVFCEVRAALAEERQGAHRIGLFLERARGQQARLDGAAVQSASALARILPMLVVSADGQRILGDGARQRRMLLDWLMFHVEPGYHAAMQGYRRALAQRNAALRRSSQGELAVWTEALAKAGNLLQQMRTARLPPLLSSSATLAGELVAAPVELRLYKGWKDGVELETALEQSLSADREQGRTRLGPHASDLVVRVESRPAHRVLSRGEGKLLVYAIALAQVREVARSVLRTPLLLLDDLPAELDASNRRRFIQYLSRPGAQEQVFITSVERPDVGEDVSSDTPVSMFHVEQGRVAPVV